MCMVHHEWCIGNGTAETNYCSPLCQSCSQQNRSVYSFDTTVSNKKDLTIIKICTAVFNVLDSSTGIKRNQNFRITENDDIGGKCGSKNCHRILFSTGADTYLGI